MADNRSQNLGHRGRVQCALAKVRGKDFFAEAQTFLHALGYQSERTLSHQTGRPEDLLGRCSETASRQGWGEHARQVRFLFQFAEEEMKNSGGKAKQAIGKSSGGWTTKLHAACADERVAVSLPA